MLIPISSRYGRAMDFEWVDAKAGRNLSKHGVSFEEAAAVFGDPDHFDVEDHFPAFGISDNARAVTLNHACRDRILAMFEHDLWRTAFGGGGLRECAGI